ncbi:hypothetical protein BDP55DRAFT_344544 [Colletotrichum godetiae]|uniref:Uncharacterized protein n=1 Tax=Colletotrichum godetiae TaxID=1209918 RepID=A0AAJ0EXU7_9PEZI|nr:uncharacterized protein BDP55DRAFT_344544 [Colletotrichum godetiae]KAK1690295.1 hypothetical protein BDP55DRAFT_344544 [Colletotrichum godetiae]
MKYLTLTLPSRSLLRIARERRLPPPFLLAPPACATTLPHCCRCCRSTNSHPSPKGFSFVIFAPSHPLRTAERGHIRSTYVLRKGYLISSSFSLSQALPVLLPFAPDPANPQTLIVIHCTYSLRLQQASFLSIRETLSSTHPSRTNERPFFTPFRSLALRAHISRTQSASIDSLTHHCRSLSLAPPTSLPTLVPCIPIITIHELPQQLRFRLRTPRGTAQPSYPTTGLAFGSKD